MRLLLDTHSFLWWTLDSPRLSRAAYAAIEDDANDAFVSAVSAMEIATKWRNGKLPGADALGTDFDDVLSLGGFLPLPLTPAHGYRAGAMPGDHKDPFDRMLAAQALIENLTLVSADAALDQFGIRRLW